MTLTLPPLNALRAFEAAARTGSYVAAAEELGVSAAAISQQIRKFEDYLGKEVFSRLNNRVILTDAGRSAFDGTTGALHRIAETTAELRAERARGRLVISCIDSLGETWLVPRLAAYCRSHPDARFELRIEPDPVDFARSGADLRLGYGMAPDPDQRVAELVLDRVQPMCSPDYAARNPEVLRKGMAAVPEADLVHTSWGPSFGSNPTWRSWHQRAGLPPPAAGSGFQAGRSSLALEMARQGLGVALAQNLMAGADIAAGRLMALSPLTLALGHPYGLAYPRSKGHKRQLLALAAWLGEAAQQTGP